MTDLVLSKVRATEEGMSSVFARLGDLSPPPEIVISRESSQQKRRRISHRDDRRLFQ